MNLITKHSGSISVIWDGEQIVQVTLGIGTKWERTVTRSYLENGQIVFSREDAPSGTMWPLGRADMEEVALMGGVVMMYADDLYRLTVMPEWWTVECQMAIEGECPEWPLAEEESPKSLGELIIDMIREIVDQQDDPEEWDK